MSLIQTLPEFVRSVVEVNALRVFKPSTAISTVMRDQKAERWGTDHTQKKGGLTTTTMVTMVMRMMVVVAQKGNEQTKVGSWRRNGLERSVTGQV
jgi:hypothetical protein